MKELWVKINDAYQQLSSREKKLLWAFFAILCCGGMLLAGASLWSELSDRAEKNNELRRVIDLAKKKESVYLKEQEELEQLEAKLSGEPLQLNGQLEALSKKYHIDPPPESTPRPILAIGKKYRAVSVSVLFPKIDLPSLLQLMQELEDTQGHIVQISQLSIEARDGKKQDLRAEITVTTYEQVPTSQPSETKPNNPTRNSP